MITVRDHDFFAHYNPGNQVFYVIYGSIMTPNSILKLYQKLSLMMREVGIENVFGIILDFRYVECFERGALLMLQRESLILNNRRDFSQIPVALLAESDLQRSALDLSLRLAPDRDRRRIVCSAQQAHLFFTKWQGHQAQNSR